MTVFQVLFILALALPIAVVLLYFLANMMDDYKIIRDESRGKSSGSTDSNSVEADSSVSPVSSSDADSGLGAGKRSNKSIKKKKAGLFGKSKSPKSKVASSSSEIAGPHSSESGSRFGTKDSSRRGSNPVFSDEPMRRKQYYNPKPVKNTADYPKDPFADYKRPDFDSYIKQANERDRRAREASNWDESHVSSKPVTKKRTKRKVSKAKKRDH